VRWCDVVDLTQFVFISAVQWAGESGDYSDLLKLLRADHPLTKQDKAALADLLEGKIKPKPGRRSPGLTDLKKNMLDRAISIVGWVRKESRKEGKPIREDDAVEIALNFMKKRGYRIILIPNRESVLTKLRRSKQPRKSRRKISTN
jgi:hypothetical protein